MLEKAESEFETDAKNGRAKNDSSYANGLFLILAECLSLIIILELISMIPTKISGS